MTITISVDPSTLTTKQREAVAGFILAFPNADSVGQLIAHEDRPDVGVEQAVILPPQVANWPSAASLDLSPESAFGAIAPQAPTDALSTAGVGQLQIAHEAPPSPVLGTSAIAPPPPALTPAAVALAPSAPAAPTNHAADVDSEGLPWDARIHVGTKGRNADGRWKAKKGINDPALVERVKAELRALMAAPGVTQVPPPPVVTQQAPTGAPAAPLPPSGGTPAAPVGVAPPAPSADPRAQFVTLIGRTAASIHAGKITQDEVNAFCSEHGVAALPLLANRLDLVALIAYKIDTLVASRQQ